MTSAGDEKLTLAAWSIPPSSVHYVVTVRMWRHASGDVLRHVRRIIQIVDVAHLEQVWIPLAPLVQNSAQDVLETN